ncbi:hypothetical protein VOI54_07385 [Tamlana sp. 2201CG12-4]|uniref:hypothetical protein n=1 Tax=Tamlana sp. 2201CG12-4 TaxID=3112582 RepID=UPI002DBBBA72|nr:hypothetical protein [Tamlana sp. 2201CG12-4]MEC3906836.1 hypothetical protein [Tamlana sp. 2201CG12-4]
MRIKNTDITIKTIGWLQIIGGVTGIGLMAYLMLNTGEINGAILFILLTGLTLFIFSVYAGKNILGKKTKKTGIILSIVNQILQIIQFDIDGNGISYSSGIRFLLGLKNDSLNFDFGIITSNFNMSINTDSTDFELMINIVALILAVILIDILKEVKNKKTMANNVS